MECLGLSQIVIRSRQQRSPPLKDLIVEAANELSCLSLENKHTAFTAVCLQYLDTDAATVEIDLQTLLSSPRHRIKRRTCGFRRPGEYARCCRFNIPPPSPTQHNAVQADKNSMYIMVFALSTLTYANVPLTCAHPPTPWCPCLVRG